MSPEDRKLLVQRVRAGVEWLDKTIGGNWRELIDPDRLKTSNDSYSILGQVLGDENNSWDDFLAIFHITDEEAINLGFDLEYELMRYHRELTHIWRNHVKGIRRRNSTFHST